MSEHDVPTKSGHSGQSTVESQTPTKPHRKTSPSKPRRMPPWRVLLHNDDVNEFADVIETVLMLTPLGEQEAITRVLEAHHTGVSLLLTAHRERAEHLQGAICQQASDGDHRTGGRIAIFDF